MLGHENLDKLFACTIDMKPLMTWPRWWKEKMCVKSTSYTMKYLWSLQCTIWDEYCIALSLNYICEIHEIQDLVGVLFKMFSCKILICIKFFHSDNASVGKEDMISKIYLDVNYVS